MLLLVYDGGTWLRWNIRRVSSVTRIVWVRSVKRFIQIRSVQWSLIMPSWGKTVYKKANNHCWLYFMIHSYVHLKNYFHTPTTHSRNFQLWLNDSWHSLTVSPQLKEEWILPMTKMIHWERKKSPFWPNDSLTRTLIDWKKKINEAQSWEKDSWTQTLICSMSQESISIMTRMIH